jgi:SRSO17 transposase
MEIERWLEDLERLHTRISRCFDRPEPRRRALAYVKGLLGPVSRKNGWQLAEQAGETSPDGMQRLLRDAHWDREAVCAELRSYLLQQFGRTGGVLVMDETPFRKKGRHSVGVKRQYCATTGQVETCQVGVFLYYTTAAGGAFIDRELYLPEDWSDDRRRCQDAGVPDDVLFQTKPELARVMLRRARDAGLRPEWTVGDAVYGSAPALRADLEAWRWAYVLGIRSTERVRPATDGGLITRSAGDLAAALPAHLWRRLRAGEGSKGPRLYDWALVPLVHLTATTGSHALLVRRSLDNPTDLALFLVFTPRAATLAEIVRAAGQRWQIETGFEAAKQEVGLGHYEVRQWEAWYRHITLALLAYAFLAVVRTRAGPAGKKTGSP